VFQPSLNPMSSVLFAGATALSLVAAGSRQPPTPPAVVTVRLSEWNVRLSQTSVPTGSVRFLVSNTGSIPHGVEIEGNGVEKEIAMIQPGANDSLTVVLKPGTYELYCPVGSDSHKKLGMETHLQVTGPHPAKGAARDEPSDDAHAGMNMSQGSAKAITVTGGGPVIQILPGPFPFPDSAGPILQAFGEEHEGLESQMKDGPYSNNVAPISGVFTISAWDLGTVRDSVDGTAEFATRDGAHWRLVLDRVQTKDVPHHPKFGGVILGLYYHGSTQVHTPLVPTINSKVALWSIGHLYRNDALVTDNAMVHVMFLSRTRRASDFALECWDCSRNPIEELQLQILPGPGEAKFDAPGGFLFVNWQKSTSRTPAS
jgi:hypothetical protein